jgi:hypothetical protein
VECRAKEEADELAGRTAWCELQIDVCCKSVNRILRPSLYILQRVEDLRMKIVFCF